MEQASFEPDSEEVGRVATTSAHFATAMVPDRVAEELQRFSATV